MNMRLPKIKTGFLKNKTLVLGGSFLIFWLWSMEGLAGSLETNSHNFIHTIGGFLKSGLLIAAALAIIFALAKGAIKLALYILGGAFLLYCWIHYF